MILFRHDMESIYDDADSAFNQEDADAIAFTTALKLERLTLMPRSPQAGAHFVIPTTVDLPPVIAEINRRMAMGIRP